MGVIITVIETHSLIHNRCIIVCKMMMQYLHFGIFKNKRVSFKNTQTMDKNITSISSNKGLRSLLKLYQFAKNRLCHCSY